MAERRRPACPGTTGGRPQLVKLGGILTETLWVGGVADAIIVGVGINVARSEYPRVLAAKASSLEAELGAPVDRAAAARRVAHGAHPLAGRADRR